MILIGRTKSGGLLLTRRRWKQFTVLGVVVAAAITLGVIISILAARLGSRSPLLPPLYPIFLGAIMVGGAIWWANFAGPEGTAAWGVAATGGAIFGAAAGVRRGIFEC